MIEEKFIIHALMLRQSSQHVLASVLNNKKQQQNLIMKDNEITNILVISIRQ